LNPKRYWKEGQILRETSDYCVKRSTTWSN